MDLASFDWMSLLQMIGVPLGLIAAAFAVKWLQSHAALKSEDLKSSKLQGTEYLKASAMSSLMTVLLISQEKSLKNSRMQLKMVRSTRKICLN